MSTLARLKQCLDGLDGWICFVIGLSAGIMLTGMLRPCAPAYAVPPNLSVAIIMAERPKMGALESEFWRAAITQAAIKHGIAPEILTAKIAQETRFQQNLVSDTGARCAAQIMPTHLRAPGAKAAIGEIESCLDKGAEILAFYINGGDGCPGGLEVGLRCYYAGPANVRAAAPEKYRWYSDAILARVYLAQQRASATIKSSN